MAHGTVKLQLFVLCDGELAGLNGHPLLVATGPAVWCLRVLVEKRVQVVGQHEAIDIRVEVPGGMVEDDVEESLKLVRDFDGFSLREQRNGHELPCPLDMVNV